MSSSAEERIKATIESIRLPDAEAATRAAARQDQLTKPRGSLGRLEGLSVQLAGILGQEQPRLARKAVITIAADHGVAAEGVSAYPQEVTAQMVGNFLRGGAAINVLARCVGARVIVVDMGLATALEPRPGIASKRVGPGTSDISTGPAMTREQAVESVLAGIEVVEDELAKGLDIVGTGDMGIGNTTPSSAICACMTGEPVEKVAGRGTGVDDARLAHKIRVIQRALSVNRPDCRQPLDVLAKLGGFEIGGLAGVILGGAAHRIPVVIDGFISGAAAMIAVGLCSGVKDYLIAAHVSAEAGHAVMLRWLGLKPLLNLGMRLGEGTGAALGIFLADAAAKTLTEMATFAEAGVSDMEEAAR